MPDSDYFKGFGSAGQLMFWAASLYELWANRTAQYTLAGIGTLYLAIVFKRFFSFVFPLVTPSKVQIYCHSVSGSWALVTGASDGIGYAFAEELLSRGFNVLLHGRNPEKLARVQKNLSQKFPKRKLDAVVADAAEYGDGPEVVAAKARSLPGKLTILVNNVGGIFTTPRFLSYSEMPAGAIDACINVNARFPSQLIRALMPVLKDSAPALIINCGSGSGLMGVAYISTYSATKAYIHTLSGALKAEMVAEGFDNIDVLGCVIGNTFSAGNKGNIPFLTITAKECARGCLDRVGASSALVYCHWRHALQSVLAGFMSETQLRQVLTKEMLKRKEEEEKGE